MSAIAVGLVGVFTDLTLHCGRRTWVMHVELPFDAWDPVARGIGLPNPSTPDCDDSDSTRTVAILSCAAPVHPAREGDVLAEAALRLLRQLLDDGRINPVRPETLDRFTDVMTALGLALDVPPRAAP